MVAGLRPVLTKSLVAGDPKDRDVFIGPMIDVKEAQRLDNWIEEAMASGGLVAPHGARPSISAVTRCRAIVIRCLALVSSLHSRSPVLLKPDEFCPVSPWYVAAVLLK